MEYEYTIDEWSVDTRRWLVTSPKKLTYDEVVSLYQTCDLSHGESEILMPGFEGVIVNYLGTEYGDDSQQEMRGDFKEEEE